MITVPAALHLPRAVAVTTAAGSSFNLGFMTLPMVFESMPLGYFAGFLFFFLLFLAAVTSSLSMLQPAIALLEEGLGINRRTSVAILGFVTVCGAMFTLYFSKGNLALGTLDTWVGTFFIYLLAMFQTILFGWVLGPKRGMDELRRGAEISRARHRRLEPSLRRSRLSGNRFPLLSLSADRRGKGRHVPPDRRRPGGWHGRRLHPVGDGLFPADHPPVRKRWQRAEREDTEVRL